MSGSRRRTPSDGDRERFGVAWQGPAHPLCNADDVHQSLSNDFSALIRARHLSRPLGVAFTLAPDQTARAASQQLKKRQFDAAPVIAERGPVGIFVADDAKDCGQTDAVADLMRPLASELVVSSEMPLSSLMRRMQRERFLFVLDANGINGFITPTDLGTVPVRTHFYLQLAHLESTLSFHLRALYPDQGAAIALLSQGARERQAKIANDLRRKDRFIDDLSCLSLDDLIGIAAHTTAFKQAFEGSPATMRTARHGLTDFRNDIMHASRTFSSSDKLVNREEHLEALIEAAASLGLGRDDAADHRCDDASVALRPSEDLLR